MVGKIFSTGLSLLLALSSFAITPHAFAVAPTTLFSDGFESGFNTPTTWNSNDSEWSIKSGDANTGSKKAQVKGDFHIHTENILLKNISTASYQSINLSYAYKAKNVEAGDYVKVEWTNDGTNWTQPVLFTIDDTKDDNTWHSVSHALPIGSENNPNFGFRFRAHFNNDSDQVFIDDVSLTGVAIPQQGKIIIEKQTLPDQSENENATHFSFTTSYSGNISLSDNQTNDSGWLTAGNYSVSENPTEGWDLTNTSCDSENNPANIILHTGETIHCTFTNTERGSVTVTKIADPNEGHFTFDLSGPSTDPAQNETSIDGSGNHQFTNLKPGKYIINEVLPEGWSGQQSIACGESSSHSGSLTFELNAGENVNCIFNNSEFAVVTGEKFKDLNANGTNDPEDSGISNWEVNLITASGTQSVQTNENGNYTFQNLPAGPYMLCEQTQEGWHQSFPVNSDTTCENGTKGYQFTLSAGEVLSAQNFGNYQKGTITGQKFEDVNGNGQKDETEQGLSGWTIQLYPANNLLEPEATTQTGEGGGYSFFDVFPGDYIVKEVPQETWNQTYPTTENGTYHFTISSGQEKTGIDFGNHKIETTNTGGGGEGGNGGGSGGGSSGGGPDNGVWNDGGGNVNGGNSGGEVLGESTTTIATTTPENNGGNGTTTPGEVLGAQTAACIANGPYLINYLFYGRPDDPEQVKKLQQLLNDHDFGPIPVTGVYGKLTRDAVMRFQLANAEEVLRPWEKFGLKDPTGQVYKTTLWWINMTVCPDLKLPMPELP